MLSPNAPSLLGNLNAEQLAAVTYPPQSALILAGAGSGKTRVLTTRIAWLLQNQMASVHSILAVTFTNKAAKEMQARLGAMLPFNLRAMWLGTFHGLCHRFLRLHHREAGMAQAFQILDNSDQLSLIKRLLKQMDISEDALAPRVLQGFINAQKENGLRAGSLNAPDAPTQRLIKCYAEYEKQCRQENVADFAELMLRSYEVLNENEILRRHYQNRFNHILVDEFQDTNRLQYAWLKLMAGEHSAIFAVGDDDQSIYRFRGAHIGNMADLMREYHIASPIKLEQNYRSVGNILAAANAVIENNSERLGKNLRTEAENGDKIRFYSAYNDFEEAQFIAEECRSLQRDGLPLSQIAVLYRSNAQSRVIEQQLFQAGIPYRIYGGLRFYERQEIKHALAYLRLAVNPDDDNALLRVINFPPRGIGSRSIETIQAAAAEQGSSLWQAACRIGAKSAKTAAFVRLIENLREQADVLPLPEILQNILDESGLYAHYQNQKQPAERERTENLDELINAAHFFRPEDSPFETQPENAENNPHFPILAFLSNASLESGETQAGEGQEAIQMMTVHTAKGLEFDAVFLSGMEEGRFPSELSLSENGGLQEERRLMYVAITRARKRLYISMAEQRLLYGRTETSIASRFVDEIPENLLHRLSAAQNHFSGSLKTPPARQPENTESETRDYHGYMLGQNVRHAKFGTGVIIDAVDKGKSARLTINFGADGIKELDTAHAKLEKLP